MAIVFEYDSENLISINTRDFLTICVTAGF
jgi:hypothetical protein